MFLGCLERPNGPKASFVLEAQKLFFAFFLQKSQDGGGWEVFRHFAGPSDKHFSNIRFSAVKLAASLRGGLREGVGLERCKRHFSQTLHSPRGLRSDLASLLGEARTSDSLAFMNCRFRGFAASNRRLSPAK